MGVTIGQIIQIWMITMVQIKISMVVNKMLVPEHASTKEFNVKYNRGFDAFSGLYTQ
jgi:hypothetical protein